jgi:ferrochelatase
VTFTDIPGLLLINLGTPKSPRPSDVRTYLREFLYDPRVIDLPAWKRRLLLELLILPFRPRTSGEAYEKIWTERGSPLLFHSLDLAAKVEERLGDRAVVALAMRYGEPSIAGALERLRERGVRRIVAFPLYPQYSTAATGSSMQKVYAEAAKRWVTPYIQVVPPFYDHPAFLDACAEQARPVLSSTRPEKVLFSFHGVPERHVTKGDMTGVWCLCRADCCDAISVVNADCYRAQCYATARLLAERLGVPEDRRVVCFQSRLGRDPWLRPYTDHVVREEPRRGVRRAAILSPAFVADCLETIEELGIRAVSDWKAAGGETLAVVPAVNASDSWADAVVEIARESTPWLGESAKRRMTVGS